MKRLYHLPNDKNEQLLERSQTHTQKENQSKQQQQPPKQIYNLNLILSDSVW